MIVYFLQNYYLHILALLPVTCLLWEVSAKERILELWASKARVAYYVVALGYIYLNLFTHYLPYWGFIPVATTLIHIALCFAIFVNFEH